MVVRSAPTALSAARRTPPPPVPSASVRLPTRSPLLVVQVGVVSTLRVPTHSHPGTAHRQRCVPLCAECGGVRDLACMDDDGMPVCNFSGAGVNAAGLCVPNCGSGGRPPCLSAPLLSAPLCQRCVAKFLLRVQPGSRGCLVQARDMPVRPCAVQIQGSTSIALLTVP